MATKVVTVLITVPGTLGPERQLKYTHVDGTNYEFAVPEGLVEGDQYLQPIKARQEVEEQRIHVRVPDFLSEDRIIEYNHATGKKFRFRVPDGLSAGDVFIQPLLIPVKGVTADESGGGQVIKRRGNEITVAPIVPIPPPIETKFDAVDVNATIQILGGIAKARSLPVILIDDVVTTPIVVDFRERKRYTTGDYCVASYRWDLQVSPQGSEISRSMLFLILKAQRRGFKYLFLDRFAVDQVSEHLVTEVVHFSHLYEFVPVVTAYGQINDLSRCWILSEIATYANHVSFREIVEVVSPKKRLSGIYALKHTLSALQKCGFTQETGAFFNYYSSPFHPFHALPLVYRMIWILGDAIMIPVKTVGGCIYLVFFILALFSSDRYGFVNIVSLKMEDIFWFVLYFTGLPSLFLSALLRVDSMTRHGAMRQREKVENADKFVLTFPLIRSIATNKSPSLYYGDAIHVFLANGVSAAAKPILEKTPAGFVMPGRTLSRGHVSCHDCRVRAMIILLIMHSSTSIALVGTEGLRDSQGEVVHKPLIDAMEKSFDDTMKSTDRTVYVLPWGFRKYDLNKWFRKDNPQRILQAQHLMAIGNYGTLFFDDEIIMPLEDDLKNERFEELSDMLEWTVFDMVVCKCSQHGL